MFIDYYEILGIHFQAKEDEIKKAYRINAIKYHPDKNSDDPFFTAKFQEIQDAYSVLSDKDKRNEFDLKYSIHFQKSNNSHHTESSSKYSYTYQTSKDDVKEKEEKQRENFRYDPAKQFYSPYDRDLQDTPQVNPTVNIWGDKIEDSVEFFKLPSKIGKIIAGFSDLKKGSQPFTNIQKFKKYVIYTGCGLVFGALIYLIFKLQSPIWISIWLGGPTLLALYLSTIVVKFKHVNYFVGINGFAQYSIEDTRDNYTINSEVNFNDLTDFYVHNTEYSKNRVYQHTNFVYVCLNRATMKVAFARSGQFNKKMDLKLQGSEINFYRAIERYWTVFLLDRMEIDLQKNGYLVFSLYSHERNVIQQYIKLGIGFITFIKPGGQEFTYQFNEIKKVYSKGGELRIQHKNFEKTLFFFKSGNEDVIPMLNLCNRQFFYRAIELLLGYSL